VSNADSGEPLRDVVDRQRGEIAELRASRKRLAEAEHADRRAIERALHDGVQQHLVALAVDLRHLVGLLDREPAAAGALLDEMAANVRDALAETAELAQSVYPALLEGRGLVIALRSAAERAGVTALVDVPRTASYSPEISAAVYWSCVEALSSASPGSQATVSVRDADGALTFEVEFEVQVAGHYPGGGLDRLRDRIEALDGGVALDNRPEGGLLIQGWLPLPR
jgi:signal transduction histidine kinase